MNPNITNQISIVLPEWFNQMGILAVFLTAITPFFPIPSEPIALGILTLDSSEANIWNIAFVIGIGAFFSHIIIYYAGNYIHRLHKSIKKQPNMREKHFFHKYGIWIMLIVPTASIIVPPLVDSAMLYLGHKRVKPLKLFAVVGVGEAIRIPLTFLALSELVSLL